MQNDRNAMTTSAKGIRRLAWAALAAVALGAGAASGAGTEVDCAAMKEPDRAKCEQARQVEKACAGYDGEALKACRKAVVDPAPQKEDCSRFAEGYGRNKCEGENLRREIATRCGNKTGEEFARCQQEVTAKASGAK
jgi:hypothetical protein